LAWFALWFKQEYDRISDMWMILDELSPDCDSPIYAEEVILSGKE
jgi:hypothetical protein